MGVTQKLSPVLKHFCFQPGSLVLYMAAFKHKQFDYLILGGGCAGLSLAWHMIRHPELDSKHIALVEKADKTGNDRTWCFWEEKTGPFDSLVFRQWGSAWFHGPEWSKLLDLAPFAYKMIRSEDYYAFIRQELARYSNIEWIQADVENWVQHEAGVEVQTSVGLFKAGLVFNSIPSPVEKKAHFTYLYQHFKGWVVETAEPFFDPVQPVLMDFRIDQGGDFRFMYVLPFSSRQALVEYTLFSEKLLEPDAYETGIRDYLHTFLGLQSYSVSHQEFGIIPMFSAPFPKSQGSRIVNIGTAGGRSKASTGYTFVNIQRHSQAICKALSGGQSPVIEPALVQDRFWYYDAIMLDVLKSGRVGGARVFEMLFQKNPAHSIFRFLDEDSGFLEELRIMNSVPILEFLRSAFLVPIRKFRLF